MTLRILIFIIVILLFNSNGFSQEQIYSPNKHINALITVKNGCLEYNLYFFKQQISKDAPLGIEVNNHVYGNDVHLKLVSKIEKNETYNSRGFHDVAINHYIQYNYSLGENNINCILQVRMYNDGFAFRYIVRNPAKGLVKKELSGFNLPSGSKVWFFERKNDWKLKSYAGEWLKTDVDSLGIISPIGPLQGPPLVAELPQKMGFAVITEAALYNFSGMRLEPKSDKNIHVNFTEKDGFSIDGDIVTPWRVVILTKTLDHLVNSDIITNLNPPSSQKLFADKSWIKPGRSVWSWWSLSEDKSYMSLESERKFIDYAQKLGFEYTLIDEGWESKWKNKWKDLQELCAYAKNRNVGVWVWRNWNRLNNRVNNYNQLAVFLDSIKTVGCVGVKVDFQNGEALPMISFDDALHRLAAERRIMINIHGCQKPAGEYRTYPNEITREGIRGLELNKMDQHIPAWHNAALPFTRCLLNQADYTPIGFSNPGKTTWTHQLASAYLFTSALVVMAENPEYIFSEKSLAPVIPFIKLLPTVWDETKVLDGSKIGEIAAFARRKNKTWYIAVLNGGKEKSFSCKLDFTGYGKNIIDFISDGDNPKSLVSGKKTLPGNGVLQFKMAENGGFVAKIIGQANR